MGERHNVKSIQPVSFFEILWSEVVTMSLTLKGNYPIILPINNSVLIELIIFNLGRINHAGKSY
jgi:hypothetical protein